MSASLQSRFACQIHKPTEFTRKEGMRQRLRSFSDPGSDLAVLNLQGILGLMDASAEGQTRKMSPDPVSAEAIRQALTTQLLGHPTLFFASTGSTNDVALQHAAEGAAEGLLVVADEQTAGRGRLGRSWWSPPGSSLLISILLRPPILVHQAAQLTMCLGLGAVEGIEDVTGLRAALKWPNDLLLDGLKLGGMLTELRTDGDRLLFAVLGLGLNANVQFPRTSELAGTATSLLLALDRPISRVTLLAAILAHTEAWYTRLLAGMPPHEAWAARLDTLGRRISVSTSAGVQRGIACGVTREGALLVQDEAGVVHSVWAGDVTTMRDA
jgi:BirA family transcriptional regulator, biotin operon repressor / biotin---[acetyl-CoA-carboxylase] ligase